MENWKPIPGFEGRYEVSDIGRVRSLVAGKMLKPQAARNGYLLVSLGRAHKHMLVHRLVAFAFLPKVEGKQEINHKNRNKQDNRVTNLEWVTRHGNMLHAHREGSFNHSLWRKQIICVDTGRVFASSYTAAEWVNAEQKQFSGNVSHIASNIRTAVRAERKAYGHSWAHVEEQPSTTIPKGSTPKRAEMGSPS